MNLKHILVPIFIGCAVCFSGCSGVASKATVLSDLETSDVFVGEHMASAEVSLSDVEILKRQTVKEDNIDTVWVKANVETKMGTGEEFYKMTYNLYNDGWKFEYAEVDETDAWAYTPSRGVTEEELADYATIPEDAEIQIDTDLESGLQTVRYTYTEPHTYCTIFHDETLYLSFQSYYSGNGGGSGGCWMLNTIDQDACYEDWSPLYGTWEHTADEENFVKLTIEELTNIANPHSSRENDSYKKEEDQKVYLDYNYRDWAYYYSGYQGVHRANKMAVGYISIDDDENRYDFSFHYGSLEILINYDSPPMHTELNPVLSSEYLTKTAES